MEGEAMKKFLAIIVLLVVFLAVFIPFASSNPDGLEKVAQSLGVQEGEPFWKGLMSDYSLEAFKDPYLSSLLAGVLGVLLVLAASLALGFVIAKRAEPVKIAGEKAD
jgi:ABC-type Fe3+ transport system permease subunit